MFVITTRSVAALTGVAATVAAAMAPAAHAGNPGYHKEFP